MTTTIASLAHAQAVLHEVARTSGTPYPRAASSSSWDLHHRHLKLDDVAEKRLVVTQIRALQQANPYTPGDDRMVALFAFGERLAAQIGEG